MKTALFVGMALFVVGFVAVWASTVRRQGGVRELPGWLETTIGFFTNLFDTLGIGSFATTTAIYKFKGVVDDGQIPGTLMVGHTLPSVLQAFIFIGLVQVDFTTLVLMIISSAIGAWLGAGFVSRLPRRGVRLGMGSALLLAAVVLIVKRLHLTPGGGDSLELTGATLAIGMAGNMVFGALMNLGIGLYAPCMILVSLLGMNQLAAFPIMMGSCAVLMTVGSAPFIRNSRYDLKAALGLAIGGIPGVLIAAFVIKSLSLDTVEWLVIAVVIYTATMMLRAARQEARLQTSAAD